MSAALAGGPTLVFAGTPFALPAPRRALPEELAAALEPAGEGGAELVRARGPGVLSWGGRLLFVLPRCFRRSHRGASPEARLEAMALTISVLTRYRREYPEGSVERGQLPLAVLGAAGPGTALDRIEAALALWADWRERGPLMLPRELRSASQPGRIHWPATLRRGHALHTAGGAVHGGVIRARVRADPRDELARLHRATAAEIGRSLGLPAPPEEAPPGGPALAILARARWRCFADRQRRVLALLERYHRPAGGAAAGGRERVGGLLAPEFEYVWERMLAVALGHSPRREGLRGSYRLPGGRRLPGLALRPDLLFEVPGDPPWLMVLDAKHYDDGDWPQTADLTKQLLYRLLLSDRLEAARAGVRPLGAIGSGFLFPSASLEGQLAAVRGVHDLDGAADPERPGRVVGLDVDFRRVARAYLAGRVDRGLRRAVAALIKAEMERRT